MAPRARACSAAGADLRTHPTVISSEPDTHDALLCTVVVINPAPSGRIDAQNAPWPGA